MIGCFITLLSIIVVQLANVREDLNKIQNVNTPKLNTSLLELPQTSLILDNNEKPIYEYRVPFRKSLDLEEIPHILQQLFIQSEDQFFYQHKGFDLTAITRAFILNAKHNGIEQGGSTITQQLVRNVYLTHEQTYSRKMNELILSYQLEKEFSKDKILETYLNAIYFANQAYGVEAASKTYFAKTVGELSTAEMAFIAAIPNNPTLYDPYKNFEKTKERQERLLSILAQQEVLTNEEAEKGKQEKIVLASPTEYLSYDNYISFVEREMRDLIQSSYSLTDETEVQQKAVEAKVAQVLQKGVKIYTYMDPSTQKNTENALDLLSSKDELQGASVVINHKENSIIALTGGVNYSRGDFHRGFQAVRQPGSTIKPLLSYAPYIERKNSSIYDSVDARTVCFTSTYCPSNYGGQNTELLPLLLLCQNHLTLQLSNY
ncbi:transglycosylase domain-containing protein [Mangrovibacillus cuniculi]|uniref:Penicillin-binding protein n=1 Tax=Mangrovibacillus cuniculi TaxID=2593652 RepID=A0A7S8CCA9_9BACI|nr:transglycosylase domain-containing protein [Mangrovibacillus cuniculi]QPC47341.1 penicillin-binding protein [Mangrovibacillus cuniculi]